MLTPLFSRVKKIKCLRSQTSRKCEACRTSKTACLYEDRDRYQAERGMSYSSFTQIDSPTTPGSVNLENSPGFHLKRKHSTDSMSRASTSGSSASVLATESTCSDNSPVSTSLPQIFRPAQDLPRSSSAIQGAGDLKRITVPFFRFVLTISSNSHLNCFR